jgi:S1-C subfamily serine protease
VWGLPPSTDPLYPSSGISTGEQKVGERYKVIMVAEGSPAGTAGIQAGDELVSVDGVPIDDREVSNRLVAEKRWGDSTVYKVMRNGQEVTLTVYLRRRLPEPKRAGAGEPAAATPPSGMPAPGAPGR